MVTKINSSSSNSSHGIENLKIEYSSRLNNLSNIYNPAENFLILVKLNLEGAYSTNEISSDLLMQFVKEYSTNIQTLRKSINIPEQLFLNSKSIGNLFTLFYDDVK